VGGGVGLFVVFRVNFGHLLFERFTKTVGQHNVRDFGIGNDLHHVLASDPLGEELIQSAGHRQDIDSARGGLPE
jgi:hypothetical protein